ncbi:transcriptional regulator NrdR [Candidatus Fermentibacteria bacterium]|nr:MAG: transcriptional regulator NrdR [Candidatus Fermentibacteria bacterium]
MRCPRCSSSNDRVIDSRSVKEGRATRRRRECNECGYRFTTYEYIETSYPTVKKKNGQREQFDPRKLEKGISRSCEKRPVSREQIQEMVEKVISRITGEYPDEVEAEFIGECIMDILQEVDQVAYVRFASVYRQFRDVSQFREELDKLLKG